MDRPTPPGSRHLPALDGLRGLAVLAVFASHYVDPVLSWQGHATFFWFGWMGVDFFFVLSGFLITGILIDALNRPRFFRDFYIRRSLRIFPLYYAVWAVFLLFTPFVHVEWNRYVFAQMFYMGNWTLTGASLHLHADPGTLVVAHRQFVTAHFWTLCLEEQFYLLWPLVVFLVKSRAALLRIALSVSFIVLLSRCLLTVYHPEIELYYVPYARVDSLLIGASLVLWLRGQPSGHTVPARYYLPLAVLPICVLAVVFQIFGRKLGLTNSNPVFASGGYTLLALSSAGLVLAALDRGAWLHRVFALTPLRALGTISYGFYLFHAIPLSLFLLWFRGLQPLAQSVARILAPIGCFLFFYALAWLSFRFFESPWLRLKERLTPRQSETGQTATTTGHPPVSLPHPPRMLN